MSVCEKCWGDAYLRAMSSGRTQTEEYRALLRERKDNPCPPEKPLTAPTPESQEDGDA